MEHPFRSVVDTGWLRLTAHGSAEETVRLSPALELQTHRLYVKLPMAVRIVLRYRTLPCGAQRAAVVDAHGAAGSRGVHSLQARLPACSAATSARVARFRPGVLRSVQGAPHGTWLRRDAGFKTWLSKLRVAAKQRNGTGSVKERGELDGTTQSRLRREIVGAAAKTEKVRAWGASARAKAEELSERVNGMLERAKPSNAAEALVARAKGVGKQAGETLAPFAGAAGRAAGAAVEAIDPARRARRARNLVIVVVLSAAFLYGLGSAIPSAVAKYRLERRRLDEAGAAREGTVTDRAVEAAVSSWETATNKWDSIVSGDSDAKRDR